MNDLMLIVLAWMLYGVLHSWLASKALKRWIATRWPAVFPAYRLLFNLLALLLIVPPLWLTVLYPGPPLWTWPLWVSWPLAALVALGFVWSLKWYDGSEFLGLRQWRAQEGRDLEGLVISPMHRHVRHPWYALGLLLLWTRDLNAAWLATAVAVTVYVVIGSRLEEKKLADLYGPAYERYRSRVPGLIPLPGKSLSAAEAEAIRAMSARSSADE